jgi:hypothetical protein
MELSIICDSLPHHEMQFFDLLAGSGEIDFNSLIFSGNEINN